MPALLLLALLSACGGQPSEAEFTGPAARPRPVVSGAEAAPVPETEAAPSGAETAALPPARAPVPPEPRIDADPKRLMGLDEGGLAALLGPPEFRRRDRPAAEFWRYRGAGCMLDVFLYGPEKPAAADKRITVRYVEARPLDEGRASVRACLRSLLKARAARGRG